MAGATDLRPGTLVTPGGRKAVERQNLPESLSVVRGDWSPLRAVAFRTGAFLRLRIPSGDNPRMTRIERFDPLFYGKDTTIGGSARTPPSHGSTALVDITARPQNSISRIGFLDGPDAPGRRRRALLAPPVWSSCLSRAPEWTARPCHGRFPKPPLRRDLCCVESRMVECNHRADPHHA